MRILHYCLVILIMSACAKVEKQEIIIDTNPHGAAITISEKNNKTGQVTKKDLGISPVKFKIIPEVVFEDNSSFEESSDSFSNGPRGVRKVTDPKYSVLAIKDGYFAEEQVMDNYNTILQSGKFVIKLKKSPLWWDTTLSDATNQWINLIVSPDITDKDMWQRVVDAVTKRYPDLKEYDFTSGYLVTMPKIKIYSTPRGSFILRSKFIATVMERDPLTYRLKLVSEWSTRERSEWHPYPRVFTEDAELVQELMSRFQAY